MADQGVLFLPNGSRRLYTLQERVEYSSTFTDVVSDPDSQFPSVSVCVVSFDGSSIDHVGLLRKMRRVANGIRQVRFESSVEIEPLDFQAIRTSFPVRMRRHLDALLAAGGGLVPPGTWAEMKRSWLRTHPLLAAEVERLSRMVEPSRRSLPYTERAADILAFEKDAVGVALTVARFDRRRLGYWQPSDEPAPFLRNLHTPGVFEDTMIEHDAHTLPGWEWVRDYQVGAIEFSRRANPSERMTIMNVNRKAIEHTLGADLLYYHHTYGAFALVQYKRFAREEASGQSRLVYRPSADRSLRTELRRMRQVDRLALRRQRDGQFRLYSGACYIKLCRPNLLDPLSTDLIPGMYLPLPFWEELCASPRSLGPRGGVLVSYETVRTYQQFAVCEPPAGCVDRNARCHNRRAPSSCPGFVG